jgi:hypothetical protein
LTSKPSVSVLRTSSGIPMKMAHDGFSSCESPHPAPPPTTTSKAERNASYGTSSEHVTMSRRDSVSLCYMLRRTMEVKGQRRIISIFRSHGH